MPSVADALRQHAPAYLQKYGTRIPLEYRKVLSYIMRCRTGQLGNVVYKCKSCQRKHWVGRSCGNRHCPNCQKEKTYLWLARQTEKLLPVQHFVVTFTVPQKLRPLLRAHQKDGYDAIFTAGSQTIRTLLKNPRNLGSDKVGFFGTLHTWGRDINTYHPHVHFVVPGGGVSTDGKQWLQVRRDQLFHPLPAKMLYKKLFVAAIRKAGLYDQLPDGVLKKDWLVNIKPVGNGQAVLKYLAPYIYRVAISDNRIQEVDSQGVMYRVKPTGKNQWVTRQATGNQFVASFAQHILPSGFQKVRYYGWMSPNCKLQLANVRWLVWLYRGLTYWLGNAMFQSKTERPIPPACRHCGGELELLAITNEVGKPIWCRPLTARGPPCAA